VAAGCGSTAGNAVAGGGSCAVWQPGHQYTRRSRLSARWSERIDERIAELERLKSGLTECIGCGCLSLDRCKLANPDDRAAGAGPGPRYWISGPPKS